VLRRIAKSAVRILGVSSKSFLLLAKDGPISEMGNQGPKKLKLRQDDPWKCEWPFQQRCDDDSGLAQVDKCLGLNPFDFNSW
jgi:hypothetical protein